MAYLQSHQTLATHPKTRKVARRLDVSLPTVIGHLHLLWYWALDHAIDGDVSRFDPDDLADAAGWEGDPDTFVKALTDCGPGDGAGFLDPDGHLHDWGEYGGKYGKRVEAARKAAAVRWHSDDDANASEAHSEGNANASGPDAVGNAEERRGEEKNTSASRKRSDRATRLPEDWRPDPEPELVEAIGGQDAAKREWAKFVDYWQAKAGKDGRKVDWQATWRNWLRNCAERRGAVGVTPLRRPRQDREAARFGEGAR
jgi:hypothetical protein